MGELKNEFSWSWSRHRAFRECRRRYWLQHYAFWGGWDRNSPADVREIYIQKRLNTRATWLGSLVHEAVEWVLGEVRQGRYPPPEHVAERFERRARREIDESSRGLYRLDPKKFPGFAEHYYGDGDDPERWTEAIDEATRQIRELFNNPAFLRLARVPERIREVERLEQIRVDGVPVWVSLDVLVDDGKDGFVIIDWKTGKGHGADEVAAQLGIYGVYVLSAYFGVPPGQPGPFDRIRTMYVNLRTGERDVRPLQASDVDAAIDTIRTSSAAMKATLVDMAENVARKDDFPQLDAGSAACGRCVFRRTCGREWALAATDSV